jgi:hypothetical protein
VEGRTFHLTMQSSSATILGLSTSAAEPFGLKQSSQNGPTAMLYHHRMLCKPEPAEPNPPISPSKPSTTPIFQILTPPSSTPPLAIPIEVQSVFNQLDYDCPVLRTSCSDCPSGASYGGNNRAFSTTHLPHPRQLPYPSTQLTQLVYARVCQPASTKELSFDPATSQLTSLSLCRLS